MSTLAMPPKAKRVRRAVHGVLLLDKALGVSSNTALQQVKRLFSAEKAGHTGTLDPLASGLLPLCFGAATKFSQSGLEADKTYEADIQFGATTTTGDAEGEVLSTQNVSLNAEQLQAALDAFLGEIEQRPPMHSALKVQGRALYEYAREGIELEREARRVRIHELVILGGQDARWRVRVRCSKGTYIRVLAEDIGKHLACGAHLAGLRRTGSGPLDLAQAVTLEQLAEMSPAQRDASLLPPDALIQDAAIVRLDAAEAGRFLSGVRRSVDLPDAPLVRVFGPEPQAFLGSGHIHAQTLIPTRLLSPIEVQGLLEESPPT